MFDDDDNYNFVEQYYDAEDYKFQCESESCRNQYYKRKFGGLGDSYKCYGNDYDNYRRRRSIATGGIWDDVGDWCYNFVAAFVDIFADGCVDENGDLDFLTWSCAGDIATTLVPGFGPGAKAIRVGTNIMIKAFGKSPIIISEDEAKEIYYNNKSKF